MRHLVDRRRIPFIKQGGRVFFDQSKLDKWMGTGAIGAEE